MLDVGKSPYSPISNNVPGSLKLPAEEPCSPSLPVGDDSQGNRQFDTLLRRASANRRNLDYRLERSSHDSNNLFNTPQKPSAVTNELLKIQRERSRFQAEKEAWA